MWLILDSLYLGDRRAASNLHLLIEHGITHILNCARELPNYFPSDFEYLALKLHDPDPDFIKVIKPACEFIDRGREEGNVLVHCAAAVSRSPSVILAYFCHLGYSLDKAWEFLDQIVVTSPDPIFLEQIISFFNCDY
ncbi:dual specificity protein phosphatase family protein [Candidatus Poribacteria bacterium]|nr:dual specificity protein phosphatase family protein [Candidatus Poribacteria bacterium]